MIGHSIIEEVLLCLQQINPLSLAIPTLILVTATVHSNLILISYVACAIITKKAFFLLAFFFAESISYLTVVQDIAQSGDMARFRYFAVFTLVAIFIFKVAKFAKINDNALICYGIMAAFMATMTYNGLAYPKGTSQGETFLYENYEHIVLLIHLLTAVSSISYGKTRNRVGLSTPNWNHVSNHSYTY